MNYLVELLLITFACAFSPFSVHAYDFQGCGGCHEETLAGDQIRSYLHVPFIERECGECHAAAVSASAAGTSAVKDNAANRIDRRYIDWLAESIMVDTSHGFLLPGNQLGSTLVVDLRSADGRFSRQEIEVPPLADLAEVEDSGRPPVISDVQVLKVERGVFLSATVGWQTDTLTNGLVRYGDKGLTQISPPSNRLGPRHEVLLHDLKRDRTYSFSVDSSDLFGRNQVSEISQFSTASPYVAPAPDMVDNPHEAGAEDRLTSSFQRLGPDYLLVLALGQPASVYIGTREKSQEPIPSTASGKATAMDAESHAGLSGEVVISMVACQNCHEGQSTATHPVNVYPKPGMTVPEEYPTLADGRITCNSCHAPHSSDYEHLARKAGRRELCVGCHRDML